MSVTFRRLLAVLGLAALLLPAAATAQIQKKGQAGFRFLENPIAAEAVGRGGVGTTLLRNASAVFWNPAGLGWLQTRYDVALHHTRGIADIDQSSAAAAWGTRYGVFGASFTWMDYGTIYGTRRAANEQGFEDTGTLSPQAYAVGLAYARAMSDRFTFGVHLKLARQDLGAAAIALGEDGTELGDLEIGSKDYALTVPAVDVGASYDFQQYGLTFGAAVQHVSREVRYENEQFPLPFNVRFSMTATPLALTGFDRTLHDVVLAVETSKGRDFDEKLQVGVEYQFMDTFFTRAGYMGGYSERGLTLGFGVAYTAFRVDYAYQRFGVFGGIHLVSLGVGLGTR